MQYELFPAESAFRIRAWANDGVGCFDSCRIGCEMYEDLDYDER